MKYAEVLYTQKDTVNWVSSHFRNQNDKISPPPCQIPYGIPVDFTLEAHIKDSWFFSSSSRENSSWLESSSTSRCSISLRRMSTCLLVVLIMADILRFLDSRVRNLKHKLSSLLYLLISFHIHNPNTIFVGCLKFKQIQFDQQSDFAVFPPNNPLHLPLILFQTRCKLWCLQFIKIWGRISWIFQKYRFKHGGHPQVWKLRFERTMGLPSQLMPGKESAIL